MPKDTRQRIIDFRPPKFVVKQYTKTTTAGNAEGGSGGISFGGDSIYIPLPVTAMTPGDGVLWFLRRATSDGAPSGRGVELKTLSDGAVSFSYVALPSGWANYITSFAATYTLGSDGVTVTADETVYVMWDQFTGFTAGDYKLNFTHSGTVDKALMLHNVSTSSPGTFYAGMSQSPTWSKTYVSAAPEGITNNYPRTLSLGGAGTARSTYAIYQMSGTVESPAALYSAPGTMLLTYTYTDPTDPPAHLRTIVTHYGDTLPTTTSAEIVAPWENGWGGTV